MLDSVAPSASARPASESRPAIFDLAEHAAADLRLARNLGDGQILLQAQLAHRLSDMALKVARANLRLSFRGGRSLRSFAGFARAAGILKVHEFDDLADFDRRVGAVLDEQGPVFVVLKVVAGRTYPQDWPVMYSAELRNPFAAALAKS